MKYTAADLPPDTIGKVVTIHTPAWIKKEPSPFYELDWEFTREEYWEMPVDERWDTFRLHSVQRTLYSTTLSSTNKTYELRDDATIFVHDDQPGLW